MTHRSALFAAVLGLGRAGSNIGDHWINAAKAVSTFFVSRSRDGAIC